MSSPHKAKKLLVLSALHGDARSKSCPKQAIAKVLLDRWIMSKCHRAGRLSHAWQAVQGGKDRQLLATQPLPQRREQSIAPPRALSYYSTKRCEIEKAIVH